MRTLFTRRLVRSSIALATALSISAGPARASGPASADPSEASDLAQAKKQYEEGRYLPAAERFEQLHTRAPRPQYLYYAGLARENLGHDAHAILHWQRALQDGLAPDTATRARTRLEQARTRTTALTLELTPSAVLDGAFLELRYLGAGGRQPLVFALTDLRRPDGTLAPIHLEAGKWTATITPKYPGFDKLAAPFQIPVDTAAQSLALTFTAIEHPTTFELAPPAAVRAGVTLTLHDPAELSPDRHERPSSASITLPLRAGDWQYTLEAPGYAPRSGTLTAAPGASPHTFALTPATGADPRNALLPQKSRRRLALGLGLASIPTLAAGAALTGIGVKHENEAERLQQTDPNGNLPEVPLDQASDRYLVGSVFLGATAGLWVGSVATALPLKRRAWLGLLGTGVIVAAGGLGWNLVTYAAFRRDHFYDTCPKTAPLPPLCENVTPGDWSKDKAHHLASGIVLGLGAGLLVAPVINLIAARRHRSSFASSSPAGILFRF